MPRLSGIDVLEIIDDLDIKVVVTTAHHEFAVQAVGTKAIAYLLKPVQPELLNDIITKLITEKKNQEDPVLLSNKLAVPVFDGIEIVDIQDILYCKSESNYTMLLFENQQKLVASKTLKFFAEILPERTFFRIHKSYLVNLNYIRKYLKRDGGEVVMSNGDIIPVSRNSRETLLKLIQNNL
jgi:two-component system LytT family response regulator